LLLLSTDTDRHSARNGQGITAANFTAAFISVLNLDVESANTITTGMLGKLGAPLNETATFSLDVFAAHNNTEHDASLSRVDILQGGVEGTIRVDRRLVDALIRDVQVTEQPGVNTRSLGHTRGRRERESTQAGSPPLSEFFTSAGQGEAALLAILFGTGEGEGRVAPTGQVKTWLLEERFPVELGYRRSADVLTIAVVGELGASNRRFQDAERNQTLPDADAGTTAGVGKGAGHVRGNDVFGVIEGIH